MKKIVSIAVVAAAATLAGCAAVPYQTGFWFTQQTSPLAVQDNATACTKRGTSEATNILGLIATGDASVEAAKKKANITKVGSVDVGYNSVLGLFGKTETIVCGE